MSNLINCLGSFVKNQVIASVNSSPDDALRVVFSAPPKRYISDLFDALIGSDGCMKIETDRGSIDVPVYLLDKDATDPHEGVMAARCTPEYLVKIRNIEFPVWLALQEVGATTNASLSTAVNPVGISKEIVHFESWLDSPVVTYVLEQCRTRLGLDGMDRHINSAIYYVLQNAWALDERYKDKRTVWQVLEKLLDNSIEGSKPYEVLLAKLGLPCCKVDEIGSNAHIKVLERVSELFNSIGLRNGLDEIEDNAGEELRDYVRDMRTHISAQNIIEANEFSRNAHKIYSPLKDGVTSLPEWWCKLGLDVWLQLLDAGSEIDEPEKDILTAKLENPLVAVPKGMLPLVVDSISLEISNSSEVVIEYTVERSNGSATLVEVHRGSVESGNPIYFVDDNIPMHDRFMRYKISADGHAPIVVKVISLDSYGPGVVIFSSGSAKASPFKINNSARDTATNKKLSRYECDLSVPGMGSHILDIYASKKSQVSQSIWGYEIDAEHTDSLERTISRISDNHYSCLIETDEECHYEFCAYSPKMEKDYTYRAYITADESKQVGARSEFDRLVVMHSASASGTHSSPRVDPMACRLHDLEAWILESDNSYRPLVLGPDYLEKWRRPDWESSLVLSNSTMILDPRPDPKTYVPPAAFIAARGKVLSYFRTSNDVPTPTASTLKLYEHMRNDGFVSSVKELLEAYFDWLQSDYDSAAWSDLVCVHATQASAKALESTPYTIMLSPFHPIRLAWQCCAQQVLQDALDKHARCPASSVMSATSFPDCFILPCRTATGNVDRKAFAAVASSSDYWGVMTSVNSNDLQQLVLGNSIFNEDFGVCIDGLASGFSAQQVVRSLDEVSRLMSAKSTIRVGISSDEGGSASCNEGIESWCTAHLGSDEDEWQPAGPRSVVIDDRRDASLHPEQAMLASLTARTDAAVRWFTGNKNIDTKQHDISIIAHLSTMSRSFDVQNIRSAVDASGLTRWRIRKQLPNQNAAFIAESRIGQVPANLDLDTVKGRLLSCVDEIERQCRDEFDSYIFAPDMANLNGVVSRSRYTALSSSDIDAACFFGSTEKAYLWDYELPSYSRRAGENSGYYLLATESPGMLQAVRSALRLLNESHESSDGFLTSLLDEISRRGMPTLKRLTTGGSMSLGEIGMLTALRLLQSEFEENPDSDGVIPAVGDDDTLTLVISADPFQRHFDDLRTAIGHKNNERPDLLVLSVRFVSGKPSDIRLTPVEVKARKGAMSPAERVAALGQASNFSEFLQAIQAQSLEVELWAIAWRNLLATMLDYGFRIYGQLSSFMKQSDWADQHSAIMRSVANGDIEMEIDSRGRLIIIDSSGNDSQQDLDHDSFGETICLSHAEALSVLTRSDSDFTSSVNQNLGDWQLKPIEGSNSVVESVESTQITSQQEVALVTVSEGETQVASIEVDVDVDDGSSHSTSSDVETETIVYDFGGDSASAASAIAEAAGVPAGIKFDVGKTINQFSPEELQFFPGNTALNQLNVGIVGDLGTGKTQLIQALVRQLGADPTMNRGKRPNVLIFDYKRDYSKPNFVKATGARVVSPFDIPLNLFDVRDSAQKGKAWLERTKFFIDVMDKIYPGIGPVQRTRIKSAVKDAYQKAGSTEKVAPTISDIFESYQEQSKSPDTPYTIMDDLVDGEYFVDDSSKVIPFSEFLQGVVVLDLAEVGQDDKTKNMLVVIFLNLFYEHMLRIEKKEFVGDDPQLRYIDTMLLVDEADNIMKYEFDILKKILLQGREFGVGVLLASQYLSHFKTSHENYLEPLLTWFVHKVPNVSVKELEGIGLTGVNADVVDTIKSLNCHECLYKTLNVDGKVIRATPFFELKGDQEN
jgi:DNA phosphorothioation-dependent restriction protein DptH